MSAAMNPVPVLRSCAFRPRTTFLRPSNAVIGIKRPACRSFADDKSKGLPKAPPGESGPNMQQQEHVSEEAAKVAKIQGGQGPDLEQGTPVQDILREEKVTRENAPQVLKDSVSKSIGPSKTSTRSFSTMARRSLELQPADNTSPIDPSTVLAPGASPAILATALSSPGHKFALPSLPLPPNLVKKTRYDPLVEQVTNLMMVDGKKAAAQRNMAYVLNALRTHAPPTYSTTRVLLPGAPPASHLPLNPILYLTLAIDSVAPLLRMRTERGAAGGGMSLQIPVPLGSRQRRRQAFVWILDAATKRRSRGSGKYMFAQKVADELMSVVEGRSAVWDRRNAVHKLATAARSNVNFSRKSAGVKKRKSN